MAKAFIAFLVLTLVFSRSNGQSLEQLKASPEWVFVGTSGDSTNCQYVFLHNKCIYTKDTNLIKAWELDYCVALRLGDTVYKNVVVKQLESYDFANEQVKPQSFALYDSKGSLLHSLNLPDYETQWQLIVPGSIGEGCLKMAKSLYLPASR